MFLDELEIVVHQEISCPEVQCGFPGNSPEGPFTIKWIKDGEEIRECDATCAIQVTKVGSILILIWNVGSMYNREANYSCAVVYADGSMEKSEPVTVRVRGNEKQFNNVTYICIVFLTSYYQSLPFLQSHSHPSLLIQVSP